MEFTIGLLEREANDLRDVRLRVSDCFDEHVGWDVREEGLAPLKLLKGRVRFVLAKSRGRMNEKEEVMRKRLEEYVMELNDLRP